MNRICCAALLILAVVLFTTSTQAAGKAKPTESVYPRDALDAKIYREFEVCMNDAKKTVGDNKLEGQDIAAKCMMQLQKYGKDRASKAFGFYFDLK